MCKVFVEIGSENSGKTTRIHKIARMLDAWVYNQDGVACDRKPPISSTDSNDVQRKYVLKDCDGNGVLQVSISSVGDGPGQVRKSYDYGRDSDVHIMASRERSDYDAANVRNVNTTVWRGCAECRNDAFAKQQFDEVANELVKLLMIHIGLK